LRGKEKELMSIKRRFDKIYSEILREEYKRWAKNKTGN
jgi:hypothetical protein